MSSPPGCGSPSLSKLCAVTLWFCLVEGSENIIDAIEHGDLNLTTNGVIQGHTKILVYLATAHRHCAGPVLKDTLILLPEILNHAIHELRFVMANLAVINMEIDSHLFTFNHLFGHAHIVWVEHEVNVRQTLD
jgi:hypothetical protein